MQPESTPQPIVSSAAGPQKRSKKRLLFLVVAVLAATGVGTGLYAWKNASDRRVVASSEANVAITAESFTPQTIKIVKGQSITWTNDDNQVRQMQADHSELEEFDIEMNPGDSFNFTFEESGTYTYRDPLSPGSFRGTVIVE